MLNRSLKRRAERGVCVHTGPFSSLLNGGEKESLVPDSELFLGCKNLFLLKELQMEPADCSGTKLSDLPHRDTRSFTQNAKRKQQAGQQRTEVFFFF